MSQSKQSGGSVSGAPFPLAPANCSTFSCVLVWRTVVVCVCTGGLTAGANQLSHYGFVLLGMKLYRFYNVNVRHLVRGRGINPKADPPGPGRLYSLSALLDPLLIGKLLLLINY